MPSSPGKLLRLHLTELDRYLGKAMHEAVVEKCRELKIAGATVFRGLEGFGETAEIHHSHVLAHDLPILIQIVDTPASIDRLTPILETMLDKGLIAVSNVTMIRVEKEAKANDSA